MKKLIRQQGKFRNMIYRTKMVKELMEKNKNIKIFRRSTGQRKELLRFKE